MAPEGIPHDTFVSLQPSQAYRHESQANYISSQAFCNPSEAYLQESEAFCTGNSISYGLLCIEIIKGVFDFA